MNERIRELAFEAMRINQKVSDDSFFVEVSKLKEFEKFAELIVKECLSVIEEMNPHDPERNIDDMFDEVYEHFGVE